VVERFCAEPLPGPFLLNVNIPNRAVGELGGFTCTRLGRRHPSEPVVRSMSPRGDTIYWVGAAGEAADASPGTDFHATAIGQVSVTPLQIDLTHTGQLEAVALWLSQGRL
jgi:5'-nucleotidase